MNLSTVYPGLEELDDLSAELVERAATFTPSSEGPIERSGKALRKAAFFKKIEAGSSTFLEVLMSTACI